MNKAQLWLEHRHEDGRLKFEKDHMTHKILNPLTYQLIVRFDDGSIGFTSENSPYVGRKSVEPGQEASFLKAVRSRAIKSIESVQGNNLYIRNSTIELLEKFASAVEFLKSKYYEGQS